MDGKILTLTVPTLVKDVLVRVSSGGGCGGGGSSGFGIGLSKEASSERLPLDYELKLGKVYYVLPGLATATESFTTNPSGVSSIVASKDEAGSGIIKRVKIVITKQQLKELLTKQISMEEVLLGLESKRSKWTSADSAPNWKPNLESIPEELR
ncbi:hypothetical protein PanWU01x14_068250 [Parasponia andersonii]|uniref:Uncharacterized protein n=1 Tax=Parasponia andersonii TaxID=3476 RepID=A0A2P5DFC6_PARAD|nr:hypothetical protein PanWU01x14_068250 [Parasponia andersonii]